MYIFRKVLSIDPIVKILKKNKILNHDPLKDLHVTVALDDKTKRITMDRNIVKVDNIVSSDMFGIHRVFLLQSDYLQTRFEYYRTNGFKWNFDEYRPHISFSQQNERISFEPFSVLLGPEEVKL